MHLCCLLKNDMNAKRSNQSKSALYKQALFSFPSLPFFATAVLYLLVFEFSIVIVNCVKELGPFCLACLTHFYQLLFIANGKKETNTCILEKGVRIGGPGPGPGGAPMTFQNVVTKTQTLPLLIPLFLV